MYVTRRSQNGNGNSGTRFLLFNCLVEVAEYNAARRPAAIERSLSLFPLHLRAQNPIARVWVLLPHDTKGSYAMGRALSGYRPIKIVTATHGKAILFQRAGQVPETPHH